MMSNSAPAPAPDLQALREQASTASGGHSDEPVYNAIERRLTELGTKGALLDFGAGLGNLTRRLNTGGQHASVTAADLFPRPADLPERIQWIRADLNEQVPVPAGSFDVVVAAEVIEHLENPRYVAREMFRLLRPGGVVVLSTPNNESLRSLIALVVRGHFVAFGDPCYPAHITALVRKDLERLLLEAGFAEPRFMFTDQGGIPGAPYHTWQRLLGSRVGGLRFSDNVIVSATKPGG